jgi:hypothetical protein
LVKVVRVHTFRLRRFCFTRFALIVKFFV